MAEMIQVNLKFYEVTSLIKRGRKFYCADSKYIQDVQLDVYADVYAGDRAYDEIDMLYSNEQTILSLAKQVCPYVTEIDDLIIDYVRGKYVISTLFRTPIALLEEI